MAVAIAQGGVANNKKTQKTLIVARGLQRFNVLSNSSEQNIVQP
jgi:hypothetical protein